mmetsp:Transcript_115330/g.366715  ORF Transcript_115330/g.366715 Transcript_115330/m.366715 type:complete len:264 (-) Transcript_115330:55-846(-)
MDLRDPAPSHRRRAHVHLGHVGRGGHDEVRLTGAHHSRGIHREAELGVVEGHGAGHVGGGGTDGVQGGGAVEVASDGERIGLHADRDVDGLVLRANAPAPRLACGAIALELGQGHACLGAHHRGQRHLPEPSCGARAIAQLERLVNEGLVVCERQVFHDLRRKDALGDARQDVPLPGVRATVGGALAVESSADQDLLLRNLKQASLLAGLGRRASTIGAVAASRRRDRRGGQGNGGHRAKENRLENEAGHGQKLGCSTGHTKN